MDAERVDGFGRQSTELSAQPRGVDAARKRGYRGSPSAKIEYRRVLPLAQAAEAH